MTWEEYETEVFALCQIYYPDATVNRNVKVKGRYSMANRQIDVLVEQAIGGNTSKIVIDCKLYNKRVDVKAVESFISMVEDIGADKGILISEKGYSKAALNRAYYNPKHIELDILSLDELKSRFHAELAILYAGHNAALLFAPIGWIIDAERRLGTMCLLYQRGLTLEEANTRQELAYVNFWDRETSGFTLEDLCNYQEQYMRSEYDVITFEYLDGEARNDARTKIRIANIQHHTGSEITGFVEFKDFIVFCVWFCSEVALKRTISKINILLKNILPLNVRQRKELDVSDSDNHYIKRPFFKDVEALFAEYVEYYGGKIVDKLNQNYTDRPNADYLFESPEVVAELKTFQKDVFSEPEDRSRSNELFDRWLAKGIITEEEIIDIALGEKPLPKACLSEMHSLATRTVERAMYKAHKQIQETKKTFDKPDASGILFLVNDGNYFFTSQGFIAIIADLIGRKFKDSSFDVVIYITVNQVTRKEGSELDYQFWIPIYTKADEHGETIISDEVHGFVNDFGKKFLNDFLTQKTGYEPVEYTQVEDLEVMAQELKKHKFIPKSIIYSKSN